MRKLSPLLTIAVLLFSVFAGSVGKAKADSFSIQNLGTDAVVVLGIDGAGTVLLHQFSSCEGGANPNFCYEEIGTGGILYRADSAPTDFLADNGTPCPAPAGIVAIGRSVCNGNYQVAGGRLASNLFPGVWESSDRSGALGSLVFTGSADLVFLNSSGDFAVINGTDDTLYRVVAQTPEPSSWVLLATGLVCSFVALRRRVRSA